MSNVSLNLADVVTIPELMEEMGVSRPTAQRVADKSASGVKLGRRTTVYSRAAVRAVLFAENEGVLRFLGLWAESESE